jgi:hypothetical protein
MELGVIAFGWQISTKASRHHAETISHRGPASEGVKSCGSYQAINGYGRIVLERGGRKSGEPMALSKHDDIGGATPESFWIYTLD